MYPRYTGPLVCCQESWLPIPASVCVEASEEGPGAAGLLPLSPRPSRRCECQMGLVQHLSFWRECQCVAGLGSEG